MADAIDYAPIKCPLFIAAHPGHELLVFHWMEINRPTVFLMTDGSGSSRISRLGYSQHCIQAGAATRGTVFGMHSDHFWYKSILAADLAPFEAVVHAGIASARTTHANLIVSDAADGYNPMHDLCEAVGAAITSALQRDDPAIRHLVSPAIPCSIGPEAFELRLDRNAQRRKRAAVAAYTPMAEEAQRLMQAGHTSLVAEQLYHPVFAWPEDYVPGWEKIGQERVEHRQYQQTIEYRRHVRPIARALVHELEYG